MTLHRRAFGGGALVLLAGIQFVRVVKGGKFGVTFTRSFGLILIGTLATALAFANVDASAKTGAYTLLGTIGGYLAGARPTTTGGGTGSDSTETVL